MPIEIVGVPIVSFFLCSVASDQETPDVLHDDLDLLVAEPALHANLPCPVEKLDKERHDILREEVKESGIRLPPRQPVEVVHFHGESSWLDAEIWRLAESAEKCNRAENTARDWQARHVKKIYEKRRGRKKRTHVLTLTLPSLTHFLSFVQKQYTTQLHRTLNTMSKRIKLYHHKLPSPS